MLGRRYRTRYSNTGGPNGYTGRRKATFQRRPSFRKRSTGVRALKEVKKLKRELNKNINIKTHTSANAITGLSSGTPSTIVYLNNIAKGTTDTTRAGNEICMKTLSYRMRLQNSTADAGRSLVRFVIVYDRRTNGSNPVWSDIFTANSVNALIKIDDESERGRYQIIHDKTWALNAGGTEIVMEKAFINLKNKKTIYDGDSAGVADMEKGGLGYILITTQNSETISGAITYRTTFVDNN